MKLFPKTIGLCVIVCGVAGSARADAPTTGTQGALGPADAVRATAIVEGDGIKVGEGTLLHPLVGIETGFVSNVFYEQSSPVAAALMRVLMQVGTSSLTGRRLDAGQDADSTTESGTNAGSLQYRANLNLNYDFFLGPDDRVKTPDGLGVGALLQATVNPQGSISFGAQDQYERILRATNYESQSDTTRDINTLRLSLEFKPTGRTLSGRLYYTNVVDVFEQSRQQFANRFSNTLGVRVNWQWLPKTRVYADFNQSFITGLGADSVKVDAFPLKVVGGVQTLVTPTTGVSARLGYTNGFYTAGASYSALVADLQIGYRYSPLGGVGVGYSYQHEDSINANYYRDHAVTVGLSQQFVPFLAVASLDLRLRRYDGITVVMAPTSTRSDFLATLTVGARYNYRNWLAFTADYSLSTVQTDFLYTTGTAETDDPSFVRHQLMAGARAAY